MVITLPSNIFDETDLYHQPIMEQELELFHVLAGCYIAGQTYNEYLTTLKHVIPLVPVNGKLPKGNKMLKALTEENETRSAKHLDMVAAFLKRDPLVYENAYEEVGKIQNILYNAVRLSPQGQTRVLNLIEKIKKDAGEIAFWKDYEQESNQQ